MSYAAGRKAEKLIAEAEARHKTVSPSPSLIELYSELGGMIDGS